MKNKILLKEKIRDNKSDKEETERHHYKQEYETSEGYETVEEDDGTNFQRTTSGKNLRDRSMINKPSYLKDFVL